MMDSQINTAHNHLTFHGQEDIYGRNVLYVVADDTTTYSVADSNGASFSVEVPTGTSIDIVYNIINSMTPGC
jgi:hypothetical protein